MPRPHDCPKCSGAMTEGFILDNTYGEKRVAGWMSGKPVRSFWTGLKTGKQKPIDIATWRCGRCGFLESYAAGDA